MQGIRGLLFDKDGTLFDFQKTWGVWACDFIKLIAADVAQPELLAKLIDFDLSNDKFKPESVAIAGTMQEIAHALSKGLPHLSIDTIEKQGNEAAKKVSLIEAVPLKPYLKRLKSTGLLLGISTNDAEASAKAHLSVTEILNMFDFVSGYDSGFGAKPDPGMQFAFCEAGSLKPREVAMIGDSTHDLIAGKTAGMATIGVLTGVADEETLAPYADVVVENIGLIPALLKLPNSDHAT